MAKTKNEVRDRAAQDLGILRIGQSLQSQDSSRVLEAYDEVYADLKDEGLAAWASTASVPDDLVPHVVALVAWNCVGVYGVSERRYQRIGLAATVAKREIRRLTADQYVSQDGPRDF